MERFPHLMASHPMSRSNLTPLATITLALVAGAAPLAAQRPDVVVQRASPRATYSDSAAAGAEAYVVAQLQKLQRSIDSLTQRFDDDDLNAAERHRIGLAIDQAMSRYDDLRASAARWNERADTRTFVRVGVGPMSRDGAENANSLSRSITREVTPRGWIGIVVTGAATEFRMDRGEMTVRYLTYPRIASVDPSSPAERAGIIPNDTLLAYNGRDVREAEISTTSLLRPNARVVIRVRREGRAREIPVIVAEAPARIKQRRAEEMREMQAPWMLAGPPEAPMFPGGVPGVPMMAGVPRPGRTPVPSGVSLPVVAPFPPPSGASFTFITNGVAGATMVGVTEGLGRTLGIKSGVLITTAPASSPAAESGLRDGDVLVTVDGQSVHSVNDVRELIGRAGANGERSVSVEYVREKRTHRATLRW